MRFVDQIETLLRARVAENYRDLGKRTGGIPYSIVVDNSGTHGDLVSDLALELSPLVKQSPEPIAESLLREFKCQQLRARTARGFLNFEIRHFSPEELYESLESWSARFRTRLPFNKVINCLVSTGVADNGGEVRLLCRALFHARLFRKFGIETCLLGERAEETQFSESPGVFELLLTESSTFIRPGSIAQILAGVGASSEAALFFWLLPSTTPIRYERAYFATKVGGLAPVLWRAPAPRWLHGFEVPSSAWNGGCPLSGACVTYLAGELDGEELDVAVPRLQEASNINWYLNSVSARLTTFLDREPKSPSDVPQLSQPTEDLLAKLRKLLIHFESSLYRAEAEKFLTALGKFLRDVSSLLNSAAFRISLAENGLGPKVSEGLRIIKSFLEFFNAGDA